MMDLRLRSKERFKGYNHGRRRKKGDRNDDVQCRRKVMTTEVTLVEGFNSSISISLNNKAKKEFAIHQSVRFCSSSIYSFFD